MKRERWGSPLVEEKYQAEKACDKRHPYRIIIVINIIIIITGVYSGADSTARGPVTETEQIYVEGGELDTYNIH